MILYKPATSESSKLPQTEIPKPSKDECHDGIISSVLNHRDRRIMQGLNARIKLFSGLMVILLVTVVFSGITNGQDNTISNSAVNNGYLFSAILFNETPLGKRWAKMKPEAEKLFPNLKLKSAEDLHVTVIYIGKDWQKKPHHYKN